MASEQEYDRGDLVQEIPMTIADIWSKFSFEFRLDFFASLSRGQMILKIPIDWGIFAMETSAGCEGSLYVRS